MPLTETTTENLNLLQVAAILLHYIS